MIAGCSLVVVFNPVAVKVIEIGLRNFKLNGARGTYKGTETTILGRAAYYIRRRDPAVRSRARSIRSNINLQIIVVYH